MNVRNLFFGCCFSLFVSLSLQGAMAVDLIWKGENYRDVKVEEIEGDDVVLVSRKGRRVTIPRKSLTWQLEGDVKKFEKAQKEKKTTELAERAIIPKSQHELERAWIHGTASGGGVKDGFRVYSTDASLRVRASRSGKTVKEQSNMRQGVPLYNGTVYVLGSSSGVNSQFSRVLWRDGYHTDNGTRLPLFRTEKPRIEIPIVAESRSWKNTEGHKLEATLKSVKERKGEFVTLKGKIHFIEITELSTEDQKFVKDALVVYHKEMDRLKREYPWLKIGEGEDKKSPESKTR